jgi:UDP-N-acetylglucosamine/UDP-N-acetylgalactosamine diphosphorylase
MQTVPEDLHKHLQHHGQEHVLAWWDRLTDAQRQGLLAQVKALDLARLAQLYQDRDHAYQAPASEHIDPVPVIPAGSPDNGARRQMGEEALRRGEVAALVVAGGQGSRLGFEHPKGMFPIGSVSKKTLFQIHAEKVRAVGKRYGAPLPYLVMTSPVTHAETQQFFADQQYFGLPASEVFFFCQGTMPALDLGTGRVLLESHGQLFLSPDGHGGTLTALASSGLLERLRSRGIRQVFYFQVDNPLVKIADPTFLGHHMAHRAEVSSKVIPKLGPTDKLGNFVQVNGRCTMIEYSDLPEALARETDAHGRLRLWAGNPAIHIFDLDFLGRVTAGTGQMPFHVARKKAPYLGEDGKMVQPQKENALKFERFIFDVLPLAERWTVVETSRAEEFAPLKNASGADSAESVQAALTQLAADWLRSAGVPIPSQEGGKPAIPLEISPLVALDAAELAARFPKGITITGPTYIGDPH